MQAPNLALEVHQPLQLNLLGHAAGALIFGVFLVLLWRDRIGQHLRGARLSLLACSLAFVWNAGSILAMAYAGTAPAEAILAVLAMALSLLPACLLDLLLAGRLRWLARAGYLLSAVAMLMHALEPVVDFTRLTGDLLHGWDLHRFTLVITSVGFAILTGLAGVALLKNTRVEHRARVTRAVASMGLFLFALSFAHFQTSTGYTAWQAELLIHHAGLPVALFLLLQDYRFLLLDAFLRSLANIVIAGIFTWGLWSAGWLSTEAMDPRSAAFALLGICGSLIFYAFVRDRAQIGLTRLLFRRRPIDPVLRGLRELNLGEQNEWQADAARIIGNYFGAEAGIRPASPGEASAGDVPDYAGVAIPLTAGLRLSLSRRGGGRRYLSEDLDALETIAGALRTGITQYREMELKRLVSEAELRALQAQIHPHFLFNALNSLYGLIPRDARDARQTVLNLSDMLRYFLGAGEKLISLSEELRIVRAYLDIEKLRLGPKLKVEISADENALRAQVPALIIQPLVENAVKHGIAPRTKPGMIRVSARVVPGGPAGEIEIAIVDTGGTFEPRDGQGSGLGVGLENVRRRLVLHFGESAALAVNASGGETVVQFRIPAERGDPTVVTRLA
jgi:hypothetical protein